VAQLPAKTNWPVRFPCFNLYRTAATHQEILRQTAAKALRLDRPRLENQKFAFHFSADLHRWILAPILAPRFGQMLEALAENEPNQ
jgi:hypothetical protein